MHQGYELLPHVICCEMSMSASMITRPSRTRSAKPRVSRYQAQLFDTESIPVPLTGVATVAAAASVVASPKQPVRNA
jgi:hypothetical protein